MLGQQALSSSTAGQLGSIYIHDTVAHTPIATPAWGSIYCVTACAFTTLTSGNLTNGNVCMTGTLASITLVAGQTIYGVFTAITLASGSVIAYNV